MWGGRGPERGQWHQPTPNKEVRNLDVGNGRNTVSRVLFRRRELTEFYGKLGEFCAKLGEVAFYTQIIGSEELTEFAPWNSGVSPKETH